MKQKIVALLIIIVMVLTGITPVWGESSGEQIPEGCIALSIVHTNDTHGQYKNSTSTVGYEKVKSIAKEESADLILDAGDTFHGLPFATVEKGKSTAEILKAVGYDAVSPGNHDFNYGSEALKNMVNTTQINTVTAEEDTTKTDTEKTIKEKKTADMSEDFKLLNANIVSAADGTNYFQPYMVKEVKRGKGEDSLKVKVGIFGLISPELYSQTSPDNVKDLRFDDALEVAKKTVAALKQENCDIIIALSHIGMTEKPGVLSSRDIAEKVQGIDVIIDGHTHAKYDIVVGDTLIAQTGSGFGNVGLIKVFYNPDTKKIENSVGKLITPEQAADYESDWTVAETIMQIEERQKTILEQPLGKTDTPLEGNAIKTYTGETNLGRVITAAYLEATGADIAFENCGGIRASIEAGTINRGSIIGVSPFGNYLVTKKISGADVKGILEKSIEMGINNLKAYREGKQEWPTNGGGSYLQLGGIKVTYNPEKEYGARIASVDIGGAPLDQDATYTVVTNQYVAASSKYPELSEKLAINSYGATEEVLATYIQTHSGKPEWVSLMGEENLKIVGTTPEKPIITESTQDKTMADPAEAEELKRQEVVNEQFNSILPKVQTGVLTNPAGSAIFALAALAALIVATAAFKHEHDYKKENKNNKSEWF